MNTSMKPIIAGSYYRCPVCKRVLTHSKTVENSTVRTKRKPNYCPNCGQKLDWT